VQEQEQRSNKAQSSLASMPVKLNCDMRGSTFAAPESRSSRTDGFARISEIMWRGYDVKWAETDKLTL